MGLRLKFNLVVVICLLIGFIAIYWLHHNSTLFQTEMNLVHQAELNYQVAESIRSYNEREVAELINEAPGGFKPQTVGSYAATQVYADTSKSIPSLSYKVAIEGSNIAIYQPSVWQQNIINQFKQDPKLPLITDKVSDAKGRFLFYAKPIIINSEVTGAKIIRIDEEETLISIERGLSTFLLILIGVFIAIILVFNLMLQILVLKPISRVSSQAEKISQGQGGSDELVISGTDEINRIAMAFNRMQRSLKAAMSMLS
ncbi:MAG: HAMP domain-containing protein [Marinicella sp.]